MSTTRATRRLTSAQNMKLQSQKLELPRFVCLGASNRTTKRRKPKGAQAKVTVSSPLLIRLLLQLTVRSCHVWNKKLFSIYRSVAVGFEQLNICEPRTK